MSSTSMIVNGTEFSTSDFSYSKPKVNQSGGKSVGILSTASKKSLFVSTPLMMTWGVNENDYDGKKSYDMSLQFPRDQDVNANADTDAFLKNMMAYEAQIRADAQKYSKDWFGKSSMSAEVIDALFTPMLKYPKDQSTGEPDLNRKPTLRIKLPFWEGSFKIEIYNLDRQQIFPSMDDVSPMDLIQKTQNVALVIQSGGLWFANGKFGTTWKLVQAVVQPKASILGNRTCHVVVSDSARATLEQERSDAHEEAKADAQQATVVESSDEEDSAKVAPEPTTPPPAPKKKKVVRKKKVVAASN